MLFYTAFSELAWRSLHDRGKHALTAVVGEGNADNFKNFSRLKVDCSVSVVVAFIGGSCLVTFDAIEPSCFATVVSLLHGVRRSVFT